MCSSYYHTIKSFYSSVNFFFRGYLKDFLYKKSFLKYNSVFKIFKLFLVRVFFSIDIFRTGLFFLEDTFGLHKGKAIQHGYRAVLVLELEIGSLKYDNNDFFNKNLTSQTL